MSKGSEGGGRSSEGVAGALLVLRGRLGGSVGEAERESRRGGKSALCGEERALAVGSEWMGGAWAALVK